MDEKQIISELVTILKRPADRETERWRYTGYLVAEGCSWRTEEELFDSMPPEGVVPLFGGPRKEHHTRDDEHPPTGLVDKGCGTCLFMINDTGTDHMLVYDDCKGEDLIAEARAGDRDADVALCIIAAKYTSLGIPLPPHLAGFVTEVLERRIAGAGNNEGGNRHANFSRNLQICWAVSIARSHYGKERSIVVVQKALEQIGVNITTDGIRKVLKRQPAKRTHLGDVTRG